MAIITRRNFLKNSLVAATALSLPACVRTRAVGANDTIRVAVVGFNGRGLNHIDAYRKIPGVKIVALCDVDDKILTHGVATFEKRGEKVLGYKDVRSLLENKEIDVVSIATPNHWHSLLTIWACQAGKDVYVEKPVSHNIWEGRQMVRAVAKYNRIVEAGTQTRSSYGIRAAVEFIRNGGLGKIKLARGLCYKPRSSIGLAGGPLPIPPEIGELGFDLWCGPAPLVPPHRKRFHYDWHWFWATGNGDLGNQGVHQVDIARWFLGEQALAPRVMSVGGRLGYKDDGETPNTLITMLEYEQAPLIFEVRGLPSKSGSRSMDKYWPVKFVPHGGKAHGRDDTDVADKRNVIGQRSASDPRSSIGAIIVCENGFVSVPDYTQANLFDNAGREIPEYKGKFKGADDHFTNFIQAVRSRKTSELHATALEGHISAGLCHQTNISYRIGHHAAPEVVREQIAGDKAAAETYGRFCEHLAANGVDLDKTPATLGPWLQFDPQAERFIGNDAANALLKDAYRPPFVVPENI